MLLSWILHDAEFDWWYNRYATRWKLTSSDVVLHLIWTCSFPHSALLSWQKPSLPHRIRCTLWGPEANLHTVFQSFIQQANMNSLLAAMRQAFTHGIYKKSNPWANGQPCGLQVWLGKPAGQAGCMLNKVFTNEQEHQLEPNPFKAPDKAVDTRNTVCGSVSWPLVRGGRCVVNLE